MEAQAWDAAGMAAAGFTLPIYSYVYNPMLGQMPLATAMPPMGAFPFSTAVHLAGPGLPVATDTDKNSKDGDQDQEGLASSLPRPPSYVVIPDLPGPSPSHAATAGHHNPTSPRGNASTVSTQPNLRSGSGSPYVKEAAEIPESSLPRNANRMRKIHSSASLTQDTSTRAEQMGSAVNLESKGRNMSRGNKAAAAEGQDLFGSRGSGLYMLDAAGSMDVGGGGSWATAAVGRGGRSRSTSGRSAGGFGGAGMSRISSLQALVEVAAAAAEDGQGGGHASSSLAMSEEPTEEPLDEEQMANMGDAEIKRLKRKQSNRESARRSRLKKQAEADALTRATMSLKNENNSLRIALTAAKGLLNKLAQEKTDLVNQVRSLGGEIPADMEWPMPVITMPPPAAAAPTNNNGSGGRG